jgi:hypothetical protein
MIDLNNMQYDAEKMKSCFNLLVCFQEHANYGMSMDSPKMHIYTCIGSAVSNRVKTNFA